MLELKYSAKFKRDYKRCKKRGLPIQELVNIIKQLQKEITLPEENFDHALQGNYAKHRECHISNDWLLIYKIDKKKGFLIVDRTGTHSDLFKN